jgi:hypothetical protein
MSVICVGKGCKKEIMPFVDSIQLNRQSTEYSEIFEVHPDSTGQRKLELLYKVSNTLSENWPLNEMLEKTRNYIFQLLARIDRGAFILVIRKLERLQTSYPAHMNLTMKVPPCTARKWRFKA